MQSKRVQIIFVFIAALGEILCLLNATGMYFRLNCPQINSSTLILLENVYSSNQTSVIKPKPNKHSKYLNKHTT